MTIETTLRVPPERMRTCCDASQLAFETTAELEPLDAPLGQDRALEALQLGVGLRRPGYNMYVLGQLGSGRHDTVRRFLDRRAAGEPVPADLCYVQNFAEPSRPRALSLPPGRGAALRDAVRTLVQQLRVVLPASFASEDYLNRRQIIDERLKEKQSKTLGDLDRRARAQGIGLIRTPMGFGLAPIKDNAVVPPEAFAQLPEAERERLNRVLETLQAELEAALRQAPDWQREHFEELRRLNQEVTRLAVGTLAGKLREAFADLAEVLAYLQELENDIVEHVDDLLPKPEAEAATPTPPTPPALAAALPADDGLRRYRVNLLVDHSGTTGAPVHFEDNPTHQNLVGRIEHFARFGSLFTDFTMLKAGALHRANGGYLAIDALKVLAAGVAWESLKRALRAREIRIESLEQVLSVATTSTLEPEPVPLDVKVVLIGDRRLYYMLADADPDFGELFKVEVDFDDDVPRSDASMQLFARLIARHVRRLALAPLERDAVARVIDHAARRAGDSTRLSTELRSLDNLLCEADHARATAGAAVTSVMHVRQALDAQRRRAARIYERTTEEITRGTILIDVAEARVGQVNGLSVSSLGNFAFGRPTRITATVRAGRGGIVDIERVARLGGALHTKGVMILSGYLAAQFHPDRPLSLSASLVFEQSYGMVDGDSASSAELYALLSALADAPLRQDLAVTGSVNQKGEVQPIGGVNEKIEGFFDVCREKGLTGRQGVVIPQSNVRHLMLRDDVVGVVEEGRFHIYAVRTIGEGLELLTGLPLGVPDSAGHFPDGSLGQRIEQRLEMFAARTREAGHGGPFVELRDA